MDNQEAASRIATLKGKLEFFKSQKADNEAKTAKILADLKAMGLASVADLGAAIENMEQDVKATESRLSKAIAAAEQAAAILEAKLQGKAPPSMPPIEVSTSTHLDEL